MKHKTAWGKGCDLIDIKQLEALVWVAKLGSFSKAGEQLFLTQPTISAHIGRLERELGVRLLERGAKAVTPSPAGEELLPYANEILRLREEALCAVSAVHRGCASLCELLELEGGEQQVVSLVGAGGKTTILFALAQELAAKGRRVAVAATTHIFKPDAVQCAQVVTDGDLGRMEQFLTQAHLVTVGTPAEHNKLSAPSAEVLGYLYRNTDALLLEADGSRSRPVKAPNEHEPVIYPKTTRIIVVMGLSALGKPIGQICHRPELACAALSVEESHALTPEDLARLIVHFYGRYGAKLTVVLNQADHSYLRRQGREIAELLRREGLPRTVLTSFLTKQFEKLSGEEQ